MNINMVEPNLPGPWSGGFEKVKQEGALTYETIHRRKDGSTMPVEVNVIYVEHEGKEYNILFARNNTERQRMEKKFRLTQYSVDHSPNQIFWVGPDGVLTYASESTCRELGYTREEMLCMKIDEIDPTAAANWDRHWTTLRSGRPLHFETMHSTRDGRGIPVEVYAAHVEYEGRSTASSRPWTSASARHPKPRSGTRLCGGACLSNSRATASWCVNQDGEVCEANEALCPHARLPARARSTSLHIWDWDVTHTHEELLEPAT